MANPERGEVDLEVGGTRYRLALGIGGLRTIQRAVSTPAHRVGLVEVSQGAAAGDIEYLRALLFGALQRYHPEVSAEAGVDQILDTLMVEIGAVKAIGLVMGKINEMLLATAPDVRDQALLKKTEPETETAPDGRIAELHPAATGTTGTGSTSRRAKSA